MLLGVVQLAVAGGQLFLQKVVLDLPGVWWPILVFGATGFGTAFLGLAQLLTGRAEFEKAFAKLSGSKKK